MRLRFALTGIAFAAAAGCAVGVRDASAHALLRSAYPPAGSTLKTPPSDVVLTFSEELEPKFSTIEVDGAGGKRVDKQDLHLQEGNAKQAIVGLNVVGSGDYKVIWHAVSVDTHRTQGSYTFRVEP